MQHTDKLFKSFDGKEIFYRVWNELKSSNKKALIIVHRGHEHSARMQHIVDELGLDDFVMFCMDARGHGLTEGVRGYSPSFGTNVKDLDCFVKHICENYDIPVENISVIAQSVGAVYALTWVHDYAPKIKCLILGSPALNINLYVPFARSMLSLYQFIRGTFFIKSYVKGNLLTHDKERAKSYGQDKLITSQIASNILLQLYENSERIVADAHAITVPTQLFISGSDYVVKRKHQIKLYENLGSFIKEKHILNGFHHDTFGEKDRAKVFVQIKEFILDRYKDDDSALASPNSLINLDKWGHNADLYRNLSHKVYDEFILSKKLYYMVTRWSLVTLGSLSNGVKLGLKEGFDSGSMLDYVYENQARGKLLIGKLFDKIYLDSPGWKGIRTRKSNIEYAIKFVSEKISSNGSKVKLVDIAAGHGRYIVDALKGIDNLENALLRDYSDINVTQGNELINSCNMKDKVKFVKGDAFDKESFKGIAKQFNIGVVSGLYELFNDNQAILTSLSGMYKAIEDAQKNLEFLTLVKSLNEKESIDKDTDKNCTDVKEVKNVSIQNVNNYNEEPKDVRFENKLESVSTDRSQDSGSGGLSEVFTTERSNERRNGSNYSDVRSNERGTGSNESSLSRSTERQDRDQNKEEFRIESNTANDSNLQQVMRNSENVG